MHLIDTDFIAASYADAEPESVMNFLLTPDRRGGSVIVACLSMLNGLWGSRTQEFLGMCDYSLQSVLSRPAKVGDKLTTRNFGTGTRGFAAPEAPTMGSAEFRSAIPSARAAVIPQAR